jgi:hypothetical protein
MSPKIFGKGADGLDLKDHRNVIKSAETTPGKATPQLVNIPKVENIQVRAQRHLGPGTSVQSSSKPKRFQEFSILKNGDDNGLGRGHRTLGVTNTANLDITPDGQDPSVKEAEECDGISPSLKVRPMGAQASQNQPPAVTRSIDHQIKPISDQFFAVRNHVPKTADTKTKRRMRSNDAKDSFKFGVNNLHLDHITPMSQ